MILLGDQFNWARFLYNQFTKDISACIPFGALITIILEHFNFDFSNEVDGSNCLEFINKSMLKRMKLVGSPQHTFRVSSSHTTKDNGEILQILKTMDTKLDNLSTRLVNVEKKVEDLTNQVQKIPRMRRKVCVSKPAPMDTDDRRE